MTSRKILDFILSTERKSWKFFNIIGPVFQKDNFDGRSGHTMGWNEEQLQLEMFKTSLVFNNPDRNT